MKPNPENKKMHKLLICLLLTTSLPVCLLAQTAEPDADISKLAQALVDDDAVPGIVAAIVKTGQPIRVGVAGVRKSGNKSPMKINDLLHLGSCTKAITATMIARMVERGELSWETTIVEGLPNLKKKIHPDYHGVTIEQLLKHTSGVPANGPWHLRLRKPINKKREAVIVQCLTEPPKTKPGEAFLYSNIGYMIAGVIAAKKKRTTWEKLVTKEVFEPLKIESAGFGAPGTKGKVDQPWGHVVGAGEKLLPIQGDNPLVLGPAGTVHMTISDWAKFALAHTSKEDNEFLKVSSLKKLHDPDPKSNYALGWGVSQRAWGKGTVLSHSGSNTMWLSTIWLAPNTGTAYLIVANVAKKDTSRDLNGLIEKLLELD